MHACPSCVIYVSCVVQSWVWRSVISWKTSAGGRCSCWMRYRWVAQSDTELWSLGRHPPEEDAAAGWDTGEWPSLIQNCDLLEDIRRRKIYNYIELQEVILVSMLLGPTTRKVLKVNKSTWTIRCSYDPMTLFYEEPPRLLSPVCSVCSAVVCVHWRVVTDSECIQH